MKVICQCLDDPVRAVIRDETRSTSTCARCGVITDARKTLGSILRQAAARPDTDLYEEIRRFMWSVLVEDGKNRLEGFIYEIHPDTFPSLFHKLRALRSAVQQMEEDHRRRFGSFLCRECLPHANDELFEARSFEDLVLLYAFMSTEVTSLSTFILHLEEAPASRRGALGGWASVYRDLKKVEGAYALADEVVFSERVLAPMKFTEVIRAAPVPVPVPVPAPAQPARLRGPSKYDQFVDVLKAELKNRPRPFQWEPELLSTLFGDRPFDVEPFLIHVDDTHPATLAEPTVDTDTETVTAALSTRTLPDEIYPPSLLNGMEAFRWMQRYANELAASRGRDGFWDAEALRVAYDVMRRWTNFAFGFDLAQYPTTRRIEGVPSMREFIEQIQITYLPDVVEGGADGTTPAA